VTLVIDASVAVKWVLAEEGASSAGALRREPEEFIAPTLIVAEIGSAIRKRVLAKELTAAEAAHALEIATGLIDRLVAIPDLAAQALALSIQLKHSIHDCFYLALSQMGGSVLVTADDDLVVKARSAKIKVRRL
jgi:predicted nucleic acid-binding protein